MMTTQNQTGREVVDRLYECFSRGDVAGVIALIDPQGTLIFEGAPSIPWTGTFREPSGWMRFFEALTGTVEDLPVQMTPFAADGERVVYVGRYRGQVRASGRTIDSPLVHCWTVRDGLIVECLEFTNTHAEAIACAAP